MGSYRERTIEPIKPEAYQLLHEGAIALSRIETNGIRVDVDYCKEQQKRLVKRIKRLEGKIGESKEGKKWKEVFGQKYNLSSNPQLASILFDHLGYKPSLYTAKDKPSVKETALEAVGAPIAQDVVLLRRLRKMKNTYLKNLIGEAIDGFMYPFFHLNTTITYRSSSSDPNFHNFPKRIPELSRLIRRAIIPRKGRRIVEVDYSGLEVAIGGCYHMDPTMLNYIKTNPGRMHFDMAMECFLLEGEDVSDDARYATKNGYVFPEFYGDYFKDCARNLWDNIHKLNLKTLSTGIPLIEHLESKGIKDYRAFEKHIERVEDNFWNKRFPVYKRWKEDWLDDYNDKGYIDTLTGFRCGGYMKKNEVINYPVQGSAFHCLLWSLIRLQKELEEGPWQSLIIGQIHDSIVLDVVDIELQDLLSLISRIMTKEIVEAWPWIIVPLRIDAEAGPVDGSWYEKEKMKI